MTQHVFIGVAWPYANGPLHVGHIAGAYLPADVFARYHRLKGNHVLMVSGSDCHGTPITLQAEQEEVAPEVLVARNHESFLKTFTKLGISFDLFTQTHSSNHHEVVAGFFNRLAEHGYLRNETLRAPYSETLRRFLPDRYVEGGCPVCDFESARGDQCDQCGRLHDPEDLRDPRSSLDGAPITFRPTEHILFELSRLEPGIRKWLSGTDQTRWRANAIGLTQNWLTQGLHDRAITRDIEWGVPVPGSESTFEGKRLYVWFEAVIGYLSASIEWASATGSPDAWKDWWLEDRPDALSVYFIGKDNIPFHTIIWPGLLIAHGGFNLPSEVPANEFLNLEGRKMSTSRGWALTLPEVENQYQPDQLRYYLLANAPETRDATWSWSDFVRRNNDELVAVWGNLANRTLRLAWRNYGQVPEPGQLEPADRDLLEAGKTAFQDVGALIEAARFRSALQEALSLAHKANLYLSQQEPWKLLKSRPRKAATVIHTALQIVCDLSLVLAPFLPDTSGKLRAMMGHPVGSASRPFQEAAPDHLGDRTILTGEYSCDPVWESVPIPAGWKLSEPESLFTKLEGSVVEHELQTLRSRQTD